MYVCRSEYIKIKLKFSLILSKPVIFLLSLSLFLLFLRFLSIHSLSYSLFFSLCLFLSFPPSLLLTPSSISHSLSLLFSYTLFIELWLCIKQFFRIPFPMNFSFCSVLFFLFISIFSFFPRFPPLF